MAWVRGCKASHPFVRFRCRLSNNISKFLLSMGPFTTKEQGRFYVDHKDEAVRGALVTQDGQVMWPPPQRQVCPGRPWSRCS